MISRGYRCEMPRPIVGSYPKQDSNLETIGRRVAEGFGGVFVLTGTFIKGGY